jgi:hypothetical protein
MLGNASIPIKATNDPVTANPKYPAVGGALEGGVWIKLQVFVAELKNHKFPVPSSSINCPPVTVATPLGVKTNAHFSVTPGITNIGFKEEGATTFLGSDAPLRPGIAIGPVLLARWYPGNMAFAAGRTGTSWFCSSSA